MEAESKWSGFVADLIAGGLLTTLLLLQPNLTLPDAETSMSYAELSALLLGVATLVVGIFFPVIGLFGYFVAKERAIAEARKCITDEFKEDGIFHKLVIDQVAENINQEDSSLLSYIDEALEKKIEKLKWGDVDTEYGDDD